MMDGRVRIVNLLDDMAFGGVTRALGVFDTSPLMALADSRTVAVPFNSMVPPRDPADVYIVHFTVNWRRIVFLAQLRARHPRAKVVLVEHSYTRAWEALHVANPRRFRLMLRLAARLVHQVVCVSQAQADWLAEVTGIDCARIAVINPYAVNPGLAALPLPTRGPELHIGAYGRFNRQKGFDTLVRAFRAGHFAGCKLLLGGFGEDEAQLRELAGDCAQVEFVGKVSDVASFLGTCDVVAVPSRWEAYGMVANEAREAGRPILVAPIDGLPEQAVPDQNSTDRAGLVIDFADPAAIAAALARLTPDAMIAMGRAGRHSTAGCGEQRQRQWAALIRKLVARPARAVQPSPSAITTR